MKSKILATFILTIFFAGCASSKPAPLYHWDGSYVSSIYNYLNDEYDAFEQIQLLQKSIQMAYDNNTKVPPGLYAHLGLLYSNLGNRAQSIAYFDKEINLYPESKNYLEFLLNQNKNKKGKK